MQNGLNRTIAAALLAQVAWWSAPALAQEDGGIDFDALMADTVEADEPAEAEAQAQTEASAQTQAQAEAEAEIEADTPPPSAAASAFRRAAGALDEVVVTAQKREEDVQDVPISVTAIGRETLEFKGIDDINAVALFAPNVNLLSTPTFTLVYMRGVGSGFNKGFEQSVATIIDGIFYSRPNYLNDVLLDVDVIETLRGPQGTLQGKNSTSGAISIRTGKPEDEFGYSLDAQYIDYEEGKDVKFHVTGPVFTDKVRLRLAGSWFDQDGDVYNTTLDRWENNNEKIALRGKLAVDIMDNMTATLGISWSDLAQDGAGHQIRVWTDDVAFLYRLFDPMAEADEFNNQNSLDTPGYVRRETVTTDLNVNWDLDNGASIDFVGGYSTFDDDVLFDADFGPGPILTQDTFETYDQISAELRYTSEPGDWEYVTGLYYFRSTIDLATTNDLLNTASIVPVVGNVGGNLPIPIVGDLLGTVLDPVVGLLGSLGVNDLLSFPGERLQSTFDQTTDSYAGFGQVTWHFNDRLDFVLGARMTYESKEARKVQTRSLGGVLWNTLVSERIDDFDESLDRSEFNFTPKASIKYSILDDSMVFFTYAEGFKGGGYNPQSADADEFEYEEESSRTYEVGARTQFFDGAWTINVTGFWTEFYDFQVVNFVGSRFVVVNAEEATSRGIEAEAFLALSENFFLHGTFGYTDAYYNSFPDGPCTAENAEGVCDLTGKELGDAIPINGTINAAMDFPVFGGEAHFFTAIDAIYQGETFRVVDLDPLDKREGFWAFGAHVGFRDAEDIWFVTVHGFNLTDEDISAGSSDVPVFAGTHFGGAAPGRYFALQARVRF